MCFVFVESISNAGMNESFGAAQPAGEKWERCRPSVKEPDTDAICPEVMGGESLVSLVSPEVSKGEGETHME